MKPITRLCKEDIDHCLCDECQTYQYYLEMAQIKHAEQNRYNPEPFTEIGFVKEYNCVKIVGFDDWVEPKS